MKTILAELDRMATKGQLGKGKFFEPVVKKILETAPEFRSQYKNVWLWDAPLFHRQRSVETVRIMTPITERLSARATTATERVRFALGCGHGVAVTVAQGDLPIYP